MMHAHVVKETSNVLIFVVFFVKSDTNILFLLANSFEYAVIAFLITEFKVVIGRGNQSSVSVCCLLKW